MASMTPTVRSSDDLLLDSRSHLDERDMKWHLAGTIGAPYLA